MVPERRRPISSRKMGVYISFHYISILLDAEKTPLATFPTAQIGLAAIRKSAVYVRVSHDARRLGKLSQGTAGSARLRTEWQLAEGESSSLSYGIM